MVSAASLSIVSSPSSPFDLPYFNKFTGIIPRTSSTNLIKFHPITQFLSIEEDVGSPNRVLVNNSIVDFMRFNKRASGELRTIIDRQWKKFPWSLLQTFLQVSLQVNNYFNFFSIPHYLVHFIALILRFQHHRVHSTPDGQSSHA